jgi:hypothetical protein|tara:strand:+ start:1010 stop:1615 length:606 start_codon:yes stop_codon:yes gene_type:complete
MGFLDNTSITVDAILTKKGRELLAAGDDSFKITKFALADDEIDYNLWDTAHPNGSNYYGAVIENMPILEAFTDQNQVMKYKLVTLEKTTTAMPTIDLGIGDTDMNFGTDTIVTAGGSIDTSFTFELNDTDVAYVAPRFNGNTLLTTNIQAKQDSQASAVVRGTEVALRPKKLTTTKSARLTVTGEQTGAINAITVTTLKTE